MQRLLTRCAEIEETIAKIYRVLAEVSTYALPLQQFWIEMACDEDDHAQQLKLATRLCNDKVLASELLPLDRVEFLLRETKRFLARLQQGPVSADKALQLTHLLEEQFMQVHINSAATFSDPQLKKMFQALAHSDREHVERLQRLVAER